MKKKVLGLMIVSLGLTVLFQNCDQTETSSTDSASKNADVKALTDSGLRDNSGVDNSSSSVSSLTLVDYDLNAVPNINPSIKAASGWPQYLEVPEGCPAPKTTKSYIHEGRGVEQPWVSPQGALLGYEDPIYTQIRHGISSGGRRAWAHMKFNEEEYSVPVFTPTDTIPFSRRLDIGNMGSDINVQSGRVPGVTNSELIHASISYCPGDYVNTTPANKLPLSSSCVALSGDRKLVFLAPAQSELGKKLRAKKGLCVLEPGEKYFYNLKLEGVPSQREKTGQSLAVMVDAPGSNLFFSSHRYSGPCLEKGSAYPVGYDSESCGETSLNKSEQDGTEKETVCYDPYNQAEPKLFKEVYSGGKATTTQGYAQPLLSRMLCESKLNKADVAIADRVCAAHREGELKKRIQTGTYKHTGVDQCQFNSKLKRFEWTRVYSSELVVRGNQGIRVTLAENDLDLNFNGCKVGNTVHPYGTKVQIACGKGSRRETAEAVCVERKTLDGSESLVGTFDFTNGFIDSISVIVDRDDRCTYSFAN